MSRLTNPPSKPNGVRPGPQCRTYDVDISLSVTQIEAFYAGRVTSVSARDVRGMRIQFPLTCLRRFVGHHGVQGRFRLEVDHRHRLVEIYRIR